MQAHVIIRLDLVSLFASLATCPQGPILGPSLVAVLGVLFSCTESVGGLFDTMSLSLICLCWSVVSRDFALRPLPRKQVLHKTLLRVSRQLLVSSDPEVNRIHPTISVVLYRLLTEGLLDETA